jgi:hypothetical protein
LICVAIFLRTYRWVYLLRPIASISAGRVFGIGLVGFTAIFFAPLRMGELARPWLLAQDRQVTFLQAAGTVAAERIIDGFALTLFFIASLLTAKPLDVMPVHVRVVPSIAYSSCAVFGAALVTMVLFYRWRTLARRLTHAALSLVSLRLADWVTLRVERLSDGFKFLPSAPTSAAFVRDTVIYWVVMLTATWLLLVGCGVPARPAQAGVLSGVIGLGSLIPGAPGFFGTYQIAGYAGLAMFFPEATVLGPGAAFIFVSYTTSVVLTALFCLVGVGLMMRHKPPGG